MSEEEAQSQASGMLNRFLKGQGIHEAFASMMKEQLKINGQTMEYWNSKFHIDVPPDLTPAKHQQVASDLISAWQEVSFMYQLAQAKFQGMKKSNESQYLLKFQALTEEYKHTGKRLPSAQTLDSLAKIDIDQFESAITIAEIEMKFWKEMITRLDAKRKIIETVTYSMTSEMRYMAAERKFDNFDKESNKGGY